MEKLSAKSLQIGDWVLYKGKPIKIIGTVDSQNIIYYYNEEDYTEYPIDASNIEPIPLTSEILVKNGFIPDLETNNTEEIHLISEDSRIMVNNVDLNSLNEWYVHIDTEDMRTLGTIELTYVHEFQNFLRLCRIKEIIL